MWKDVCSSPADVDTVRSAFELWARKRCLQTDRLIAVVVRHGGATRNRDRDLDHS
jgi:hypothetical protein